MSAELNVSRAARGASFATGGRGMVALLAAHPRLAIVGGAIVPLVTGAAADGFGLGHALFVPAACYLYIASYGWFARRAVRP